MDDGEYLISIENDGINLREAQDHSIFPPRDVTLRLISPSPQELPSPSSPSSPTNPIVEDSINDNFKENTNDELISKSSQSARTSVQNYSDISLESLCACNDDELKDTNDKTLFESTTQESVLHTTAFKSLIAVTSLPDVHVICTEKKKLNVNGYIWKRYLGTKFAKDEEHKKTLSKPEYLPISVYTLERIVHFCACNKQHSSEYFGIGLKLKFGFLVYDLTSSESTNHQKTNR